MSSQAMKPLEESLRELVGQVEQAREGFGIYHNSPSMDAALKAAHESLLAAQPADTPRKLEVMDGTDWSYDYVRDVVKINGRTYVPADAVAAERERCGFNFREHLTHQREWSEKTFGPGDRAKGVVEHIRKELREIESQPNDLEEWIDVVILALDGAWRSGGTPDEIIGTLVGKQAKNEKREWPDWRTFTEGQAIEHVKSATPASEPQPEPQDNKCAIEGCKEEAIWDAVCEKHQTPEPTSTPSGEDVERANEVLGLSNDCAPTKVALRVAAEFAKVREEAAPSGEDVERAQKYHANLWGIDLEDVKKEATDSLATEFAKVREETEQRSWFADGEDVERAKEIRESLCEQKCPHAPHNRSYPLSANCHTCCDKRYAAEFAKVREEAGRKGRLEEADWWRQRRGADEGCLRRIAELKGQS